MDDLEKLDVARFVLEHIELSARRHASVSRFREEWVGFADELRKSAASISELRRELLELRMEIAQRRPV